MRKMGEVFLLRANIAAVGSVLDSPEVFWVSSVWPRSAETRTHLRLARVCVFLWPQSYPDLRPLYDAARSYLEILQRLNLLNTRVEVLQDMLQLLKESVSSRHAERLEQIVIALIAIEICTCSNLALASSPYPDSSMQSLGSSLSSSTSLNDLIP
jgi:uncharacterized Rmd1/YagE family protein